VDQGDFIKKNILTTIGNGGQVIVEEKKHPGCHYLTYSDHYLFFSQTITSLPFSKIEKMHIYAFKIHIDFSVEAQD
jgi:hypothetical protein